MILRIILDDTSYHPVLPPMLHFFIIEMLGKLKSYSCHNTTTSSQVVTIPSSNVTGNEVVACINKIKNMLAI